VGPSPVASEASVLGWYCASGWLLDMYDDSLGCRLIGSVFTIEFYRATTCSLYKVLIAVISVVAWQPCVREVHCTY